MDERLTGLDTKRLVMRCFTPDERKLLNRALRGDNPADIARELGISRQCIHQRIDGILWRARCNKRLANDAGFEPAKGKLKMGLSVRRLPSARKIA